MIRVASIIVLLWTLHAPAAVVRVGVLLATNAIEATNMQRGVEVAVELAKARGVEVQVIYSNAHGQWGTAGDEAARLVLDEKVGGLVAPAQRDATHLALQVAGRTRTRVATLCAEQSVTTTGIPWCARVVARAQSAAPSKEFVTHFVARFGIEPGSVAVAAADALVVLTDTCDEQSWPSCGHEHVGATGLLRFDSAGNRVSALPTHSP